MATSVQDLIRMKALQYGVDPTLALAIAKVESGFNPAPPTGNGGGLYQFDKTNWGKYGQGDITDPAANADAFMRYYKDYLLPGMTKQLGRMPTPGELYLGHQQGVAGAGALLTNPDSIAVDTLSGFYPNLKAAKSAITSNGGAADMSAADFAKLWNGRLNSAAASLDPDWAGADSAIVGAPNQPAMMAAAAGAAPGSALPPMPAGREPMDEKIPGLAGKPYDFGGLTKQGMGLLASNEPPLPQTPPPAALAHPGSLMTPMMMRMFNPMQTPLRQQQVQQLPFGLLNGGLV